MKLTHVRVENYKSIEDSGEFDIDQVTCLVGKNESGKTAILEALQKLKPVPGEDKSFDEEEFPRRHLSTYREREGREPANVLTTTWELEDDDVEAVEEVLAEGVLTSRRVVVTKGYDNTNRWHVSLNEDAILEKQFAAARLSAPERSQLGNVKTVGELLRQLGRIDEPTEKQRHLKDALGEAFPRGGALRSVIGVLAPRMPHFVYFADYDHLPGRVALNDLKRRKKEDKLTFPDRIFLALLDMTSTSLADIEEMSQLERLIMELEAVEARLTDEIREYWSQNRHLEVRFRYDAARKEDPAPFNEGYIFNTRIYNTRHRATVNFEERSHGFIWFFSFLVWFSQVKREYGENVVILLDEPGLPLHGRAQEDLLRYINERLRPHHQVMYTAHSPFMIDVENVYSLRTVDDVVLQRTQGRGGQTTEEIKGTKVGDRILSRDEDTLFPLQGILGFNVAQTLFVGPFVLVVEGPTEKAVLDWFSKQLVARERMGLDLRWAICPSEGATKVSSFVTLFAGRDLKIAVLMDYHEGQKGLVDKLDESGLLADGHLFRTKDFTNSDESDIEDVIGRELYVHLVNASLQLPEGRQVPMAKPADGDGRVVKEVEGHCRLLPPTFPEFNHWVPIQYLLSLTPEQVDSLPGLGVALDRFEATFGELNQLTSTEGG